MDIGSLKSQLHGSNFPTLWLVRCMWSKWLDKNSTLIFINCLIQLFYQNIMSLLVYKTYSSGIRHLGDWSIRTILLHILVEKASNWNQLEIVAQSNKVLLICVSQTQVWRILTWEWICTKQMIFFSQNWETRGFVKKESKFIIQAWRYNNNIKG